MVNFGEDTEIELEQAIQQQAEEKETIARQVQEGKTKAAKENAALVEQIKKQIPKKQLVEQGKGPVSLNAISLIIIICVVAAILIFKRRRLSHK